VVFEGGPGGRGENYHSGWNGGEEEGVREAEDDVRFDPKVPS